MKMIDSSNVRMKYSRMLSLELGSIAGKAIKDGGDVNSVLSDRIELEIKEIKIMFDHIREVVLKKGFGK